MQYSTTCYLYGKGLIEFVSCMCKCPEHKLHSALKETWKYKFRVSAITWAFSSSILSFQFKLFFYLKNMNITSYFSRDFNEICDKRIFTRWVLVLIFFFFLILKMMHRLVLLYLIWTCNNFWTLVQILLQNNKNRRIVRYLCKCIGSKSLNCFAGFSLISFNSINSKFTVTLGQYLQGILYMQLRFYGNKWCYHFGNC